MRPWRRCGHRATPRRPVHARRSWPDAGSHCRVVGRCHGPPRRRPARPAAPRTPEGPGPGGPAVGGGPGCRRAARRRGNPTVRTGTVDLAPLVPSRARLQPRCTRGAPGPAGCHGRRVSRVVRKVGCRRPCRQGCPIPAGAVRQWPPAVVGPAWRLSPARGRRCRAPARVHRGRCSSLQPAPRCRGSCRGRPAARSPAGPDNS
jgi:hypothetical protein